MRQFNLSRWAIEHARLTLSIWLAIAVAGCLALSSLKFALFPSVNFPVVVVRAESSLTSVLATEQQLTNPLETLLAETPGLTQLFSATYSGQTVFNLLLDTKLSIEDAETDINRRLKQASLTQDSDIKIIPFNLNETSAISYVVTGSDQSISKLNQIITQQIVPKLAQLSGVQRVDILGTAEITQEADKLDIPTANSNTLVRFNGQQAIAFQVIKTANANTLEVVQLVEQTVKQFSAQFSGISISLAETPATYIRQATRATMETLLGAVSLAILVIFPFLRSLKATLITAITIPISLLGTFLVMAGAGFNLETLTLLALALAIGIIVDDAIVEVENIMRHLELGNSPREAALAATQEIGLTASISTLTIVAVFLPIGLMGGTLGQFFRPFGLTISAAVLTSLLAARTLVPVLAMKWLTRVETNTSSSSTSDNWFAHQYRNLLAWSLSHRRQVILIAIASFIAGIALIPLIPQGFVPQLDRGEFKLAYTTSLPKFATNRSLRTANSTSPPTNSQQFSWLKNLARSPEQILLRRTFAVGHKLESSIMQQPEVATAYTIAGFRGDPNKGQIYIKLKEQRSISTSAVQDLVRQNLPPIPRVIVSIEDIPFVETGEDPSFKVALAGTDLKQLRASALQFQQEIAQLPGFKDVRLDGVSEPPTKIIHLDRRRVAYLNANLSPEQGIGDASQIAQAIATEILPPDIEFDLEGDSARAQKILGEFLPILALAILAMLIVLYWPFRRWLEPLVIGLSLPLSIVGAMAALLITQSDLGMISLIGLIFLLGLLDKNAILLLDYVNQLRNSGMERSAAILQTGAIRLRPIVMTTFSTILGMLPVAIGWGAGSELRQPMAVGIIGGLITSSLLSLIVVPILYSLLEDYRVNKL